MHPCSQSDADAPLVTRTHSKDKPLRPRLANAQIARLDRADSPGSELVLIPIVGLFQPLPEVDLRPPPQAVELGHVQELPRSAIRLACVEVENSLISHDVRHQSGQFADREV